MLWAGIFAIAEFIRVKTLMMIISRKRPVRPIVVVKLQLDCSVKLPLGDVLDQESAT
jgi:hypothetical protein